ncbi:MAG: hypothetical protein ABIH34_07620 [Nanoarchaeota archaeon]
MKWAGVILFLALIGAAAAEELVFNDWILNDDDLKINNQVFSFIFSTETRIFAKYMDQYLVIANNSCAQSEIAKICMDDSTFDTAIQRYKAKVRAYSIIPDISITRTIDYDEIPLEGYATITTTITNNGGNIADDAIFVDDFGNDFLVKDADGAVDEGSRVIWEGGLGKGRSRTITYDVWPRDIVDHTYLASFSYFDGFKRNTVYSPELHLTSVPFFKVITTPPPTEVLLGRIRNITVNLSNDYKYDTTVDDFRITFSEGLEVIDAPSLMRLENKSYVWDGIIRSNQTTNKKSFFFRFMAKKAGGNQIAITGVYTDVDGVTRKTPIQREDVNVKISDSNDLEIWTNVEQGEQVESFEELQMKIWIQNKNTGLNFTNVSIFYETTLPGFTNQSIDILEIQEQRKIFDETLVLPEVNATMAGRINIVVEYATTEGDPGREEYTLSYTHYPIRELIIEQEVSPSSLEGDQIATVIIRVKNQRTVDISTVEVKDTLPQFRINGLQHALFNINREDTKTAYQYQIVAPRLTEIGQINLTTTAMYSDERENFTVEKKMPITVTPKMLLLTLSREVIDSSVHTGELSRMRYTIVNSDREPAFNISLHFPLQPDVDLYGDEMFTITQLNPGERVVITNRGQLRFKKNESITLSQPWIDFVDQYGNRQRVHGSTNDIKINQGFGPGPLILIKREVGSQAMVGEGLRLEYQLFNLGDQDAQVQVSDNGKDWELTIGAHDQIELAQELIFDDPGSVDIMGAIVRYYCLGSICSTTTVPATAEISPLPHLDEEPVEGNERIAPQEPDKEEEEDEFLVSIWQRIKTFLRGIFPGGAT